MINKFKDKCSNILFELNLNTDYKYKIRSKEITIYNNCMIIEVCFDNHDLEVFVSFVVDKTCSEFFKLTNNVNEVAKDFDMSLLNSLFDNFIQL